MDVVRDASDPLRPLDRRLLDDPGVGSVDSGWSRRIGVAVARVDGNVCGESIERDAEREFGRRLTGWATTFDRCLTRVQQPLPLLPLHPHGSFQMGWFGSSTPEPIAVSREGRRHCWDSRDAYFKCLDNARILKPGDEDKTCASENVAYEKNCAKSWVCCFSLAFPLKFRIEAAFLDRIL